MIEGWETFTLGEIERRGLVELGRGKVISKKDLASDPGNYPVYSAAKDNDGKFGERGSYMFDEELITWTVDGGGRLFHRPHHRFSITNVGGFLRILDASVFDYRFLFYALSWQHSRVNFDWVKKAHPSVLRKVYDSIPIPSIEEQKHVVEVLDDAFYALGRATGNVKTNLYDLDIFFRTSLKRVFLKPSPKKNKVLVGDLLTLQRGKDITKKQQRPGTVPVVSSGGVKSYHDTALVKAPGVVVGRKGSIGKVHFINTEFWPHDTTLWVKDFKGNTPLLVSYLLRGLPLKELDTGAANPSLNRNLVHLESVYWPSEGNEDAVLFKLQEMEKSILKMKENYISQLSELESLRQSFLQRVFIGEPKQSHVSVADNENRRAERLSTSTLVLAFDKHLIEQRQNTFGHVKAQKTLHLTESLGGLDLGRQPQVRQAGPHDQEHFSRVEAWAKQNGVFEFKQRRSGGYTFTRGMNYNAFLSEAKTILADYEPGLSRFLPLLVDMNTEEAEVFTTVHAAWNNLLADGKMPSEDDIVTAARENWHESKMAINRQKFFDAITKIRRHDLEPDGTAKYVSGVQESLI